MESIPEEIIPLLESCWAQDPRHRPEFTEVTAFLSGVLANLAVEAEQVAGVEPEPANEARVEESEDIQQVMIPASSKERKRKKKGCLPSVLGCFYSCLR